MQRVYLFLIVQILLAGICFGQQFARPNENIVKKIYSRDLAFTENQGQWDKTVLFAASVGGARICLNKTGAVYELSRFVGKAPDKFAMSNFSDFCVENMSLRAEFLNSNTSCASAGEEPLEFKSNFFIGNEPQNWRTEVRNYTSVKFTDLYPGIDLRYYGSGRELESDYIVAPGADINAIALKYEGAKSLFVNPIGDLVIGTEWGTLTQVIPTVYQIVNGEKRYIEGRYRFIDKFTVGFEIDSKFDQSIALVIDPVLKYSTYLGGNDWDVGYGVALDASRNCYVAGFTRSTNFPTANGYDNTNSDMDIFVSKFSSDGNRLLYSTFIGGSSLDIGYAVAVDINGSAYVTGGSTSIDFPTINAYDYTYNGTVHADVVLTKLNASGNAISYSTYLGSTIGYAFGIAVNSSGNAYVTGVTDDMNFPTTAGTFDNTFNGYFDVFLTEFSPSGDSLVFSTLLGGSSDDRTYGIALGVNDRVYLTGWTFSNDFPTTPSAYDRTFNGDTSDVFVTAFSSRGDSLVYSTYVGGNGVDRGYAIVLDANTNAYITGATGSTNFPTVSAYDASFNGEEDAFYVKLNSTGSQVLFSTYLGGSEGDYAYGISLDKSSRAIIVGATESNDFPTTADGNDLSFSDSTDAFLVRFSSNASNLNYSTYLGENGQDIAYGVTLDPGGNALITGWTSSTSFPTVNPHDATYNSGIFDATLLRIGFGVQGCSWLVGDANGDGMVNISDMVYLLNYVFHGGPSPTPNAVGSGDADANFTVSISDIVYLQNYIFLIGAPAPGNPDNFAPADCTCEDYQ